MPAKLSACPSAHNACIACQAHDPPHCCAHHQHCSISIRSFTMLQSLCRVDYAIHGRMHVACRPVDLRYCTAAASFSWAHFTQLCPSTGYATVPTLSPLYQYLFTSASCSLVSSQPAPFGASAAPAFGAPQTQSGMFGGSTAFGVSSSDMSSHKRRLASRHVANWHLSVAND